jgi:hypothetical protein
MWAHGPHLLTVVEHPYRNLAADAEAWLADRALKPRTRAALLERVSALMRA